MALTFPLPTSVPSKWVGFEAWMERALEQAGRVQPDWDADDIHDLRVAFRRCRTMADALSQVNPAPGWRKLKKTSRELFHALGVLRDTQVERARVKKMGPTSDPVRKHMLRVLARAETKHLRAAE